jgi:hypothetical protein
MIKPIPNFSGYSIASDGRVWSEPRKDTRGNSLPGRWLRLSLNKDGYYRVCLRRDSRYYTRLVHRLVLEIHIGPCPPGMVTCHFPDRDPSNNRLENLRWDTPSANQLDAVRHGTASGLKAKGHTNTQGEANGNAKLTETEVRQILEECRTGSFMQTEIAGRHGMSPTTMNNIVRGKVWRHLRAATTPIVPVAA